MSVNVTAMGRCKAKRRMRAREYLKFRLLGSIKGFDPDIETRCIYYPDHIDLGQKPYHQDLSGTKWSD